MSNGSDGPTDAAGGVTKGGGSSTVTGTEIDGDLHWEGQSGALEAADDNIGGNLQASDNSGGLIVDGNVIGGNLRCEGNDPVPSGRANRVEGDMEDQCSGF